MILPSGKGLRVQIFAFQVNLLKPLRASISAGLHRSPQRSNCAFLSSFKRTTIEEHRGQSKAGAFQAVIVIRFETASLGDELVPRRGCMRSRL